MLKWFFPPVFCGVDTLLKNRIDLEGKYLYLYNCKIPSQMNKTDRASIFIVCLFYVVTMVCGYLMYSYSYHGENNPIERLILTIHSHEINSDQNSTIVYEDRGGQEPTQKIFDAGSVIAVSNLYEEKGYQLEYISEYLKKVMDQEVLVTRIWFSKTK